MDEMDEFDQMLEDMLAWMDDLVTDPKFQPSESPWAATLPAGLADGSLYYDPGTDGFYVYQNGKWILVGVKAL